MTTVSIFKNGKNQAVRFPKDMEYKDVSKLEIIKNGNERILRPIRPDWLSFAEFTKADDDFMIERQDVITNEGRFNFE